MIGLLLSAAVDSGPPLIKCRKWAVGVFDNVLPPKIILDYVYQVILKVLCKALDGITFTALDERTKEEDLILHLPRIEAYHLTK